LIAVDGAPPARARPGPGRAGASALARPAARAGAAGHPLRRPVAGASSGPGAAVDHGPPAAAAPGRGTGFPSC